MQIGLHGNIELPVKCCKPDSARHSTINIIANRLMALWGFNSVAEDTAYIRVVAGSIPVIPTGDVASTPLVCLLQKCRC